MPKPKSEKSIAFSKRLKHAVKNTVGRALRPKEFILEFQFRHHGEPVSNQAIYKWLNGTVIPKSENMATLVEWLKVDEHWLRYGPSPSAANPQAGSRDTKYPLQQETIELATKIESLSPNDRHMMEELVDRLYDGPPKPRDD